MEPFDRGHDQSVVRFRPIDDKFEVGILQERSYDQVMIQGLVARPCSEAMFHGVMIGRL